MPTIAAVAMKGGVSKTSTCHCLAGAFALAGLRVLLVDNDPQASLTAGIFGAATAEALDPASTVAAVYGGMDPLPSDVIRPAGLAGVDLVPGSMAAARFNIPEPFLLPPDRQVALRDFLAEARVGYDVVLVDCPPNLAAASWSALVAADHVIVPLVPEEYGASSLSPVLNLIRHAQSGANPELRLLGLLLTLVQPRLAVHMAFESALREVHGGGVLETRIALAADVKEAIATRKPITHHKPRGASAKAFRALADEILARVGAGEAATLGGIANG